MTRDEYKSLIVKEHGKIVDAIESIKRLGRTALDDESIGLSDAGSILDLIGLIEITDYTKDLRNSIFESTL